MENNLITSYYCHCKTQWESVWDSACDDECPVCGGDIEPYAYREQGETDTTLMPFVGNAAKLAQFPEGGLPEGIESINELEGWPPKG